MFRELADAIVKTGTWHGMVPVRRVQVPTTTKIWATIQTAISPTAGPDSVPEAGMMTAGFHAVPSDSNLRSTQEHQERSRGRCASPCGGRGGVWENTVRRFAWFSVKLQGVQHERCCWIVGRHAAVAN